MGLKFEGMGCRVLVLTAEGLELKTRVHVEGMGFRVEGLGF